MFLYQAAIILAVLLILILLVVVFRVKKRGLLIAAVLLLSVGGAAGVLTVQNYFGAHVYTQKVDMTEVKSLTFSDKDRSRLDVLFSDYTQTTSEGLTSYEKVYHEKAGAVSSTVTAEIHVFPSREEADRLFSVSQKFYENKFFAPIDSSRSLRQSSTGHRYLVTYIKTQYSDYTDLLYRPSRMASYSNIIVQDDNIVVMLSEHARKPVCTKDAVLRDILRRL